MILHVYPTQAQAVQAYKGFPEKLLSREHKLETLTRAGERVAFRCVNSLSRLQEFKGLHIQAVHDHGISVEYLRLLQSFIRE